MPRRTISRFCDPIVSLWVSGPANPCATHGPRTPATRPSPPGPAPPSEPSRGWLTSVSDTTGGCLAASMRDSEGRCVKPRHFRLRRLRGLHRATQFLHLDAGRLQLRPEAVLPLERTRPGTSIQSERRSSSQRASAASARARSRSARACCRSYSERQSRGAAPARTQGTTNLHRYHRPASALRQYLRREPPCARR